MTQWGFRQLIRSSKTSSDYNTSWQDRKQEEGVRAASHWTWKRTCSSRISLNFAPCLRACRWQHCASWPNAHKNKYCQPSRRNVDALYSNSRAMLYHHARRGRTELTQCRCFTWWMKFSFIQSNEHVNNTPWNFAHRSFLSRMRH